MPEPEVPDTVLIKGNEGLKRSIMKSPDPHIRRYALFMLGSERDPENIGILVAALGDPDKGVRAQAAVSLGEMGVPAEETLVRLIANQDWKIRYRAAEALGMIPGKRGVPALVNALGDEKDHVRYMAAKSLGIRGDGRAVAPLTACLNDENEYVRNAAARALGMIAGPPVQE
jgi:HEAT repeat protein